MGKALTQTDAEVVILDVSLMAAQNVADMIQVDVAEASAVQWDVLDQASIQDSL
jgi:hypothetical protein